MTFSLTAPDSITGDSSIAYLFFARVRAAFFAEAERSRGPFVLAAFRAAAERSDDVRLRAAE